MLLFPFAFKTFYIKLQYIKDSMGNPVAVTIPLDYWIKIRERYKDLMEAEEIPEPTEPVHGSVEVL